jgi:hypothetical protein
MFDIVSLNWPPSDVPTTVALLFLVSGLLCRPPVFIIDSGQFVPFSTTLSRLSMTFFLFSDFFLTYSRYMLLSPVIGIAIDKYAPSASALHLVLVLGFSLQALCFVLLKVRCSHASFQVFLFFARSQLPPQPPLMSTQYYSESWNGRAATWAAGWYRCKINFILIS